MYELAAETRRTTVVLTPGWPGGQRVQGHRVVSPLS